jgi:ABC-type multidrug transport system ATPase subunit
MSISVHNLSKSYKDFKAIEAISFDVNEGELFGLIGPDGAGKTTIFRILTTLLLPNEGVASVAGFDVVNNYKSIRNSVGYMPGKFSLYQDLTVEENLQFFATMFGATIEENYDLIRDIYIQIEPFKKRRAGALSGGMKQKLALCCALIHKPKVLFLDEPTTGVDPVSRKEFWEMLKRLQQKGITILVSTPYMDEASLCDRIALIQKGKIFEIDSPQNIISKYSKTIYAVSTQNTHQLLEDLKAFPSHYSVFAFGEFIHYIDQNSNFKSTNLQQYLESKRHTGITIQITTPTIEDVFMDLTSLEN